MKLSEGRSRIKPCVGPAAAPGPWESTLDQQSQLRHSKGLSSKRIRDEQDHKKSMISSVAPCTSPVLPHPAHRSSAPPWSWRPTARTKTDAPGSLRHWTTSVQKPACPSTKNHCVGAAFRLCPSVSNTDTRMPSTLPSPGELRTRTGKRQDRSSRVPTETSLDPIMDSFKVADETSAPRLPLVTRGLISRRSRRCRHIFGMG